MTSIPRRYNRFIRASSPLGFLPSIPNFEAIDGLRLNLDPENYEPATPLWTDASTYGADYVDNVATADPTKVADFLNGRPVVAFNGSQMLQGNLTARSLIQGLGGYSIISVVRTNAVSGTQNAYGLLGNGTSRIAAVNITPSGEPRLSARRLYSGQAANLDGPPNMVIADDWYVQSNIVDHSNNSAEIYINGVRINNTTNLLSTDGAGTITNSTHSGTAVGSNWQSSEYLNGYMAQTLLYSDALTPAEHADVMSLIHSRTLLPVQHSQTSRLVILHGDSIISGSNLSNQTDRLAYQVWKELGSSPYDCVLNMGRSGARMAQLIADAAEHIDQIPQQSGMEIVLVIGGGTNDADDGRTAIQITTDLMTYLTARNTNRADIKVVVCTPIARSSVLLNDVLSTYRDNIIAGGGLVYDAVADLWGISHNGDTRFDSAVKAGNTTYYLSDALHPNAFGTGLHAQTIAEAVGGL